MSNLKHVSVEELGQLYIKQRETLEDLIDKVSDQKLKTLILQETINLILLTLQVGAINGRERIQDIILTAAADMDALNQGSKG